MIPLPDAKLPTLVDLLQKQPELAMFPLDNLALYGLNSDQPRSMSFWVDDLAAPRAALGLSREGMVMPFAPQGLNAERCGELLRGKPLMGFVGQAGPVRAILKAAGLVDRATGLDKDEPHFLLDLDALEVPDGPGDLAPISEHSACVTEWRVAYDTELHVRIKDALRAAADVQRWIERDSHRVLLIDGQPAALTGFNATLPGIVQVGGVYTPPEARGRGLARRAVALHLAEARARGVRKATLFAASAAAVACYRPLGFQQIGEYALVLFDGTVTP